jgi:hypothetical protein
MQQWRCLRVSIRGESGTPAGSRHGWGKAPTGGGPASVSGPGAIMPTSRLARIYLGLGILYSCRKGR